MVDVAEMDSRIAELLDEAFRRVIAPHVGDPRFEDAVVEMTTERLTTLLYGSDFTVPWPPEE